MTITPQHVLALKQVMEAIVDSVAEAGPHGAPSGTLYATLMSFGCSLESFERIMGVLVEAGRLEKRGHLYFATLKGKI